MSELACVLCKDSVDDALQFGEKITCEDTTAHLYCLLLTSNLMQHGDDDVGLYGFMPKDIKSEIRRTKKLFCAYCSENGATIGCCIKSCRRSFHLPCALKNDCRFEFNGTFRSFCEDHHDIKKPKNAHKPGDLCTVCYDEMGEYNPIRSIPLPCCNKDAWCHKLCPQKYAQTSGYFLKCPLCKDSDRFREWIACRGVFIPDRDAKWEVEETGPNSFYAFEHHTERPSECIAKVCKCSRGRKYQVDAEHHKYTLIFCNCCGSNGVHLSCMTGKEFLCDDCEAVWSRKKENPVSTPVVESNRASPITATILEPRVSTGSNQNRRNSRGRRSRVSQNATRRFDKPSKEMIAKFKLRECSVRLIRLTTEDISRIKAPKPVVSQLCSAPNSVVSQLCPAPSDSEYESSKSSTQRSSSGSSSDEQNIRPTGKNSSIIIIVSDSDADVKMLSPTSSGYGSTIKYEIDINKNSNDMPSSNLFSKPNDVIKMDSPMDLTMKIVPNSWRMRQISSSEDEPIRPTGSKKVICLDSSDDQIDGKENEVPTKSVAIIRPYVWNDTSSDDNIKPAKIKPRPRRPFSSSDDTSDDLMNPFKVPETSFKPRLQEIPIETAEKPATSNSSTPNSPKKRKRRSVLSYFGDASSSEDEVIEQKPKRRSPKVQKRSPIPISSNQSTMLHFFKRDLNHNI